MGAGASIEEGEAVDKERAKVLAGEDWFKVEAKFEAEANDEGFVSAERCREYLTLHLSEGEDGGSCTKKDLLDESVVALIRMLDGVPQLHERNLDDFIQSQSMSETFAVDRKAMRRARIAKEAEAMLGKFEAMTPAQQKRATNNGDMEHYTEENQELRESFFTDHAGVNAQLDLWWKATETYIDVDGNDVLTAEEYSLFHRRLLKIAEASAALGADGEEADGGEGGGEGGGVVDFTCKDDDERAAEAAKARKSKEWTEEEAAAVMEEDFKADAGEDGAVSKEEFRYAVFQMADQWTCSVDADEYVEFLKQGYKVVFDDLITADKALLPKSWAGQAKHAKGITLMPFQRAADVMSGLISEKIKADKVDKQKGTKMKTLEEFALDHFQAKHGAGRSSQKVLKSFCLSLLKMLEDEANELHEYALLFAQMAGVFAPSGRIKPLPPSCTSFILNHLDGVRGILKTTKRQSASGQAVRSGTDARSKELISGLLELDATKAYLARLLQAELGLNSKAPLFKVAMVSLVSLSVDVAVAPPGREAAAAEGGKTGPKRVVQCMRFTILLAVVYAAWEETATRKEVENGVKTVAT